MKGFKILINQKWVDALINRANVKYVYPVDATVCTGGGVEVQESVRVEMVDDESVIVKGSLDGFLNRMDAM